MSTINGRQRADQLVVQVGQLEHVAIMAELAKTWVCDGSSQAKIGHEPRWGCNQQWHRVSSDSEAMIKDGRCQACGGGIVASGAMDRQSTMQLCWLQ